MTIRGGRRTVLKLLGGGIGSIAAAGGGLAQESEPQYAIAQGGDCAQVQPLQGTQPVEELYDYAPTSEKRWSSNGTVALQRDDTSIVFLYQGPRGTSLVFVHGRVKQESADESSGGSASFRIDLLPESGEWLVEDDNYDGENNYDNWRHEGEVSEIDWTWAGGRTDGGVFAGLTEPVLVLIEPAFNDAAALDGEHYDGEVTSWQFLTGELEEPDRIDLVLDEPLTIGTGRCVNDDDGDSESRRRGNGDEGRGRGPPDDHPGRGPPAEGDDRGRGPPDDRPGRGPRDDDNDED